MTKSIKLQWYSDPSHSWLKVSRSDVHKLGLTAQSFTPFSYQSTLGNTFYLEEDCDAPLLLDTLRQSTEYLPTYRIDRHTNGRSHVRLMRSLTHTTIITKLWNDDALDKLEQYIQANINLRYPVPRPSPDYPWNAEMFREVYQSCIDYIHQNHRICYARTNGEIVVTTDQELAKRDLTEKLKLSGHLHIVNYR